MTPIADMVERMLANNDPPAAIVAAVRAFESVTTVTLRNVTQRYASRSVTQEQGRLRSQNFRNRKKSQQVAKANDVATAGEIVTVPAVTRNACSLEGPYNSIQEDSSSNRKEEESKKLVVVRARATRMPAGAPLTEDFVATAIELGADRPAIPKMWAEFVDYWCALPGSRGTKLDWLATWRNRLRQIVSKGQKNGRRTVHEAADDLDRYVKSLQEPAPDGLCGGEGQGAVRLIPSR